MNDSTIDFINETDYENNPFASVPDEVMTREYPKNINVLGYYLITATIIKLILVLAVIAANIFLVIVIIRFRRLKAVRTNMYILNLSILNIIYYLCSPLFYLISHLLSCYEVSSVLILQTQSTLLTLYTTFAVCMGLDWFLSVSKPQLMRRFQNVYRFVFTGIYIWFFIEWMFAFIYSRVQHIARAHIFIIFYVTYLLILTIMNILKRRMNLRSDSKTTEYAFTISNVIIYSYLPVFIFHLLYFIPSQYLGIVLLVLEIIPDLIETSHPILVVYMLARLNKYFGMAYAKSFRRSVQNYEDEDLDAISVEYSGNVVDVPIYAVQEDILVN